jgi:hypothetical protein
METLQQYTARLNWYRALVIRAESLARTNNPEWNERWNNVATYLTERFLFR